MKVKIDPNKALAELCKRSFYRFIQEFWSVVIPEEAVYNWHIKYLADELQELNGFVMRREPKPYDLIINIPPGSTKSTIITQMYNAWVWTIDPAQRFISSSYSGSLSVSHAIKTRDIVKSDKYRILFPHIKLKEDQQGKTDYWNTLGGERYSTSTGGTVTGVHAHQIIIDDPINPKQSSSKAERESADEHVNTTLSSRKVEKEMTPTIVIMQRLHEEDPTGILLQKKNKKIKHICLPARESEDVKPSYLKEFYVDGLLDPIRLSEDVLTEAKSDLGSYGFAGQYDQNPAPIGGGLIKKDWFPIIEWDQEYSQLKWHFVADTAYTSQEKNDPSGYIAYARKGADYIIRGAETEYLEFPELIKALPTFAHLNGYTPGSIIEIEPKASGKSLVQTLKRNTSLNVKEGVPPAKDKTARVNDASPVLESGRVMLIRGIWNKDFLDQISTFPNAAHDEYVDCLTMMVNVKPKRKGQRIMNR